MRKTYRMEQDYVPASMSEARKRWREHTRHVVTDAIRRWLKEHGTSWNEDARGPFIQVDDVKLRFWKRRTAGNSEHVYCGVAVR